MQDSLRIGARLRAARKAAGFQTAKSFLKKYKFPASTFSQHESGARVPDDETLGYYSKVFEINLNWLKTGKGLPHAKSTANQKKALAEELINISKPTAIQLNEELLAKILTRLLTLQHAKISAKTIKSLSKEASKIYQEITSTSTSSKIQMNLLKAAFVNYNI